MLRRASFPDNSFRRADRIGTALHRERVRVISARLGRRVALRVPDGTFVRDGISKCIALAGFPDASISEVLRRTVSLSNSFLELHDALLELLDLRIDVFADILAYCFGQRVEMTPPRSCRCL